MIRVAALLLSLSPELYGQMVEYDKWHHPSSMDTMQSKAMAFNKYMQEHMATAEEFRGPHKCVDGMAGPYPCSNTDLVALVTDEYQGEAYFNDIWGWTDPEGHEYVIQGMKSGTNFIDISTPEMPVIVGYVSSQVSCECGLWCGIWRDIRTYGNFAYIVSENEGHGIQTVDLTQLRGRKDAILSYRARSRRLAEKTNEEHRKLSTPAKNELVEVFGIFAGKTRNKDKASIRRNLLFGPAPEPPYDECKPSTLDFTSDYTASDAHNVITFSVEDQAAGAPPVVITVGTDNHLTAHPYNRGPNGQGPGDKYENAAMDTVCLTLNGEICGGGLGIFDVGVDPANPKYIGCHGNSHTHDTHCLIYKGPDADHYGKPICISSNDNHIDIVDMSVAFSPKSISKLYGCGGVARTSAPEPFPSVTCDKDVPCPPGGPCQNWKPSYVHQGWLTTDHKYFLLDDETDELDGFPYEMGYAPDKRLSVEIFDMTDLDAPFFIGYDVKDYDGYNHNIFTKGELVIRADYEHGIQFEDQNGAATGKLDKLGFFDTDPPYGEDHPGLPVFTPCTGDSWLETAESPYWNAGCKYTASWGGSWGVYPFFPSGLIVASSNSAVSAGTFILNYTGPASPSMRRRK